MGLYVKTRVIMRDKPLTIWAHSSRTSSHLQNSPSFFKGNPCSQNVGHNLNYPSDTSARKTSVMVIDNNL